MEWDAARMYGMWRERQMESRAGLLVKVGKGYEK